MTEEQPVPARRPPRPGSDFRRRALAAHGAGIAPSVLEGAGARASLVEELAAIPDLQPGEDLAGVAGRGDVAAPPPPAPAPAAADRPSSTDAPVPSNGLLWPVVDDPDDEFIRAIEDARAAAGVAITPYVETEPKRQVPMAALGAMIAVLALAVPLLGLAGFRIVEKSTDGRFTGAGPGPKDPGYEVAVDPTPTAVFLQHDAEGVPVAATYLSLSGANGGGSIIFVPLGTAIRKPALGIDRLSKAYETFAKTPTVGRQVLATQVTHLLNAGADDVIDVDDAGWAELVRPVGKVSFVNPDRLTVDGVDLPPGPVTLTPEQVGPYLAAKVDGESDLNRLNRHQVFWTAWLGAIKAAGTEAAVPGESTSGIGLFTKTLANGPVSYDTVPVSPSKADPTLLVPDWGAVNDLVTRDVPAPVAAYFESRKAVRLLNGVSAGSLPDAVLSTIVSHTGTITSVGNGPRFGQKTTQIVYGDPADRNYARMLKAAFGGTAELTLDRAAPDSIAVTVIIGQDALDYVALGSTSTTTTTAPLVGASTTPSGN